MERNILTRQAGQVFLAHIVRCCQTLLENEPRSIFSLVLIPYKILGSINDSRENLLS